MVSTTTLPYFKLDSGAYLTETAGLPFLEKGIYVDTMAQYWEADCNLPSLDLLRRRLRVTTKKELAALDTVLAEFFPGGVHERLIACRAEAREVSRKQSDRAKAGHARRGQGMSGKTPQSTSSKFDASDF